MSTFEQISIFVRDIDIHKDIDIRRDIDIRIEQWFSTCVSAPRDFQVCRVAFWNFGKYALIFELCLTPCDRLVMLLVIIIVCVYVVI